MSDRYSSLPGPLHEPLRKCFVLPPRTPVLDHHRPGGSQLLGTAMGIDMLLRETIGYAGGGSMVIAEDVAILAPCVVSDDMAHRLAVDAEVMALRHGTPWYKATLYTPQHPENPHFTSITGSVSCRSELRPAARFPSLTSTRPVTRDNVYEAFFHGDAFQVIAEAVFSGDRIAARYRADEVPARLPPVARLIEFGLQTSGLLEVALSGMNKIPKRIGRIAISPRAIVRCQRSAFALAHRADTCDATSVDVYNATGIRALSISDYKTVVLPFEHDREALQHLRALLLRSAPCA